MYWNRIYHRDARDLSFIPDGVVSLTVTSPMYLGAGVKYSTASDEMNYEEYVDLHMAVYAECYRVTEPGGRIAIVVANVGRKPYVYLDRIHAGALSAAGFEQKGCIIWDKGPVFGTAWGSWLMPTAPELRDRHEYIIIAQKPGVKRSQGRGDITSEEFTAATQSIWTIQPASAKKVGHPAPFPIEIPQRLIRLYTYKDDLLLDPFNGSGTTCQAAELLGRRWIGVDIDAGYCELAEANLKAVRGETA